MAPPWKSKSLDELIDIVLTGEYARGYPAAAGLHEFIQQRVVESQLKVAADNARAGERLAGLTGRLVATTRRLGTVTWWLVAGTFLLGASAAVDVVLKIIRAVH